MQPDKAIEQFKTTRTLHHYRKQLSAAERINKVEAYFCDHGQPFTVVHAGNVDELHEKMTEEKMQFERMFAVDKDEPLTVEQHFDNCTNSDTPFHPGYEPADITF